MFYIVENLIFTSHCFDIVNLLSEIAFCCITWMNSKIDWGNHIFAAAAALDDSAELNTQPDPSNGLGEGNRVE